MSKSIPTVNIYTDDLPVATVVEILEYKQNANINIIPTSRNRINRYKQYDVFVCTLMCIVSCIIGITIYGFEHFNSLQQAVLGGCITGIVFITIIYIFTKK